MGSVCVVRTVGLHQFVGRAYDGRFITRLSAYALDPASHCGIRNVPEIPCYQIIDAIRNGNGDVRGIIDGLARKRPEIKQVPGEFLGVQGCIKKRNAFEGHHAGVGRILVARSGFRDDERRGDESESVRRISPPLACYFLIRCDHDIAGWSRSEIADNRCFDVCGGLHGASLSTLCIVRFPCGVWNGASRSDPSYHFPDAAPILRVVGMNLAILIAVSGRPDRAEVCEVPFRPSVNPSARELAHARGEDAAD